MTKKKSNQKSKKNLQWKEYSIEGMHCPSCELLMEKQFKKLEGVEKVEADSTKRIVKAGYIGNAPTTVQINELINKYNYNAIEDGSFAVAGKTNLQDLLLPFLLAIIFLIIFLQVEKLSGSLAAASSNSGGLLQPLMFGLAASISSCAALIGGLILSLTKDWNNSQGRRKPLPLLQFNIGRLASFIILGGFLGAAGGLFRLSIEFTAVIVIAISLLMVFLGAQMLNVIPALNKFQIKTPKAISRKVVNGSESSFPFSPLLVGIGTFFLPCAFTLITQTDALKSGSFLSGATIMGAFALGTLPVLTFIGVTAKQFSLNPKYSNLFLRTAGIVVVLFALYTINNQMNVLGLPTITEIFTNN